MNVMDSGRIGRLTRGCGEIAVSLAPLGCEAHGVLVQPQPESLASDGAFRS
jgi:hypothetical protein